MNEVLDLDPVGGHPLDSSFFGMKLDVMDRIVHRADQRTIRSRQKNHGLVVAVKGPVMRPPQILNPCQKQREQDIQFRYALCFNQDG